MLYWANLCFSAHPIAQVRRHTTNEAFLGVKWLCHICTMKIWNIIGWMRFHCAYGLVSLRMRTSEGISPLHLHADSNLTDVDDAATWRRRRNQVWDCDRHGNQLMFYGWGFHSCIARVGDYLVCCAFNNWSTPVMFPRMFCWVAGHTMLRRRFSE